MLVSIPVGESVDLRVVELDADLELDVRLLVHQAARAHWSCFRRAEVEGWIPGVYLMSKPETPLTRHYWDTQVGGLLVEEFCLVHRVDGCGGRWVDGLILPDREKRIADRGETVDIEGQRVVLVQTKINRLGMYLMDQTLFSRQLLLQRFRPASVESVALCTRDDVILRPMLQAHAGCRVVVIPMADVHRRWQPRP